jgi:NADH-quinone oxidoreductase subunit N
MSAVVHVSVEYGAVSPMLIVFGAGVLGVLVETFVPSGLRSRTHAVVAFGGLLLALLALATLGSAGHLPRSAIEGAVAVDGLSLAVQAILLVGALPAVALLLPARGSDVSHGEAVPLSMLSLGGMMAFAAANDLLTLFVALEVLSLPLYLLAGLAVRREQLSIEAAVKYFLLGAFSSAILLFGIALRFGATGSTALTAPVIDATASATHPLGALGAALLGVGLLFKVGAVPFHSWVPDVYQGAPTAVTAFMASAVKVAGFAVVLRVTRVGLTDLDGGWRPAIAVVAALTLVVSTVIGVLQTDVKRLLAYSSISHAGFVLVGVFAGTVAGTSAAVFYLAVYSVATVAGFAVLTVVRDESGEVAELARWAGLGRRRPLLAGAMALLLLSFAGIPLTAGFVGKFAVFTAAADRGGVWLVVLGVLCSAVAAVFYLRVVVVMYFAEEPPAPVSVEAGWAARLAIGFGVLVVVAAGLFPQPLLHAVSGLSVLAH